MYLKSLELFGFKSFAKKSELHFNSPITAIVGPNGSGKSNVAEAFRFVLGEQSIKSMRGKKTEDLIWNGGGDVGRANRASVKVIFDNKKRVLSIDFDEVTIERVIYRDSSSEYYVNGSQVRLKDVIELLAAAHIGASGHHIISQGEADKILNASLKDRREMLEDALGLKIYQYKRLESERKLGKTDENIVQIESLRKEIAPHLKFLKKQVEKVEKAMVMKEELKKCYKEYLKREDVYLRLSKRLLEAERIGPEAEKKRLEGELHGAREVLARRENKDEKSDALLAVEDGLALIRGQKDSIVREMGRIEGEIASEERVLHRERELAHAEDAKTVPLKAVREMAGAVEQRIAAAEDAKDFSALRIIFSEIKRLIAAFIEAHKDHRDSSVAKEAEGRIADLKKRKLNLERDLTASRHKEAEQLSRYAGLEDEIEKEKNTEREAEKNVFKIVALQNEVNGILNALKSREERIAVEESDFKRDLAEAAILVGRDVLAFGDVQTFGADNILLEDTDMYAEDRHAQQERRKNIERIKIRLEDFAGGASEDILKEFKEVSDRDAFLERELADLSKSAEALRSLIKDLEMKLDLEFKQGIEKINRQFKEFFTLMFGGGEASLSLVREKKRRRLSEEEKLLLGTEEDIALAAAEGEEEGEEGVEINVNLPRKKTKGLMMLSGGERALTSIALLFAISQVNPPPFIILDETDAALDEANSKKYGDMIENLSRYSQLIVITHNRETMSRAGILYGVTMDSKGVSKLLSIQFDEAVVVAK